MKRNSYLREGNKIKAVNGGTNANEAVFADSRILRKIFIQFQNTATGGVIELRNGGTSGTIIMGFRIPTSYTGDPVFFAFEPDLEFEAGLSVTGMAGMTIGAGGEIAVQIITDSRGVSSPGISTH